MGDMDILHFIHTCTLAEALDLSLEQVLVKDLEQVLEKVLEQVLEHTRA